MCNVRLFELRHRGHRRKEGVQEGGAQVPSGPQPPEGPEGAGAGRGVVGHYHQKVRPTLWRPVARFLNSVDMVYRYIKRWFNT